MQGGHQPEPIPVPTDRIAPKVLTCVMFRGMTYARGTKAKPRYTYDYELELILEGSGYEYVDDKLYPVQEGDVLFRTPGHFTQGIMPYNCYLICFDLTGDGGKDPASYDPLAAKEFQPIYANPILDALPTVYHSTTSEVYYRLFDRVFQEMISPNSVSPIIIKSCILQIIYQLYRDQQDSCRPCPHYSRMRKVLRFINDNLDSDLDLQTLSEHLSMSPFYFHKVFTAEMGITPNKHITRLRVEKAKRLLASSDYSISEIALQCGFKSTSYFGNVFKKSTGTSPSTFRQRYCF
jgi:AraC family transcriptional regulator